MTTKTTIIHSWIISPQKIFHKFRTIPHFSVIDVGMELLFHSPNSLDLKRAAKSNIDMKLSIKIVAHMFRTVDQGLPLEPFEIGVDEEYRVHIINHKTKEDN